MREFNLNCISSLYDEVGFYNAFLSDLEVCRNDVIIESPYITVERMELFHPVFENLINRGIKIFVITRDPQEQGESLALQSEAEISWFENKGIQTLMCAGNHHRKLAIIDRKILWEGSLNILSHKHSREIMRRLEGSEVTLEMINFLNYGKFLD